MRLIDADALVYELTEMVRHNTGEYKNGIAVARLVVMDAPTIGGWISVKDRLPECSGRYICRYKQEVDGKYCACTDFGSYDTDREENGGWYTGEVTHWMPLPELPKGEE